MAIRKQPKAGPAKRDPSARPPRIELPKMPRPSVLVPYHNLPVWNHAEYGRWKPVSGPPMDATEYLYWDEMTQLVARKWPQLLPGAPFPSIVFARMKADDGSDPWCSIDMLVIEKPAGTDVSAFLSALRDDNLFSIKDCGRFAYVSPFFEWGLADYWEQGYYDR